MSIALNGTSTVTADLYHNSDGTDVSDGVGTLLDGSTIAFGTTLGTLSSNTVSISGGQAMVTFTGTTAGTAVVSATFDGVIVDVPITVNKATPVITWNNPTAITYGTALGGTQLNATANVEGSFDYGSNATGAVLPAGSQTLYVTFTPNNTNDYTTVTATVNIIVTQASTLMTPVSSTASPSAYGQKVTFTVTVSSNSPGTLPVGQPVLFTIDSVYYGSALINSIGQASISDALLTPGTHTITASYLGDSNFIGSNDAANPLTQTVNAPLPATFTAARNGDWNNPATWNISLNPSAPPPGLPGVNYPTSIDTVNIGGTYQVNIEASESEVAKTLNIVSVRRITAGIRTMCRVGCGVRARL